MRVPDPPQRNQKVVLGIMKCGALLRLAQTLAADLVDLMQAASCPAESKQAGVLTHAESDKSTLLFRNM